MPDLTQPHQGQNRGPFKNIEDREKRIFKIRKLNSNLNGENVSYEVLLDEKEDGSIGTTHINQKFYSNGGYEIMPTTVTGICGICNDVIPADMLKHCNCGRILCPKCRKALGRYYYCKWSCVFLCVCNAILKGLLRIIIIPFRDIYRG